MVWARVRGRGEREVVKSPGDKRRMSSEGKAVDAPTGQYYVVWGSTVKGDRQDFFDRVSLLMAQGWVCTGGVGFNGHAHHFQAMVLPLSGVIGPEEEGVVHAEAEAQPPRRQRR